SPRPPRPPARDVATSWQSLPAWLTVDRALAVREDGSHEASTPILPARVAAFSEDDPSRARRHRWRSVRVVTRLRPSSRARRTVADLVDLRVQRAHPRPHVASVPDVPGVVGEVRAQEEVAPLVGR